MTSTQFVDYNDDGFWAYDVALGSFLKHLIDAAEESEERTAAWLATALESWRVVAGISDYGLTLGPEWSEAERQTFLKLAEQACTRLASRAAIPATEIVQWALVGNLHIHTRGATEVATAPIVELGRAIIALVSGRLPAAPEGTWWFYGTPEGRSTIGRMQLL